MSATGRLEPEQFSYKTLEPYVIKRFEWRIERYSHVLSAKAGDEAKQNYSLKSPMFGFMNRVWFLQLYPNIQPTMHLSLCLAEGDTPITVNANFGISKVDGHIEWQIQRLYRYVSDTGWSYSLNYRRTNTLISKGALALRKSEFVKDDVLTIICSVTSEECIKFLRDSVYNSEACIPVSLLPERRPRNLILIVQNIKMLVDYTIIRLYCPAIGSQVQPGGTYMITFNPKVFRYFLLYLYTGRIVVMTMRELILLFCLANTYKMFLLRDRCLRLITAIMVPQNAVNLLIFAESFGERDLTRVVYKYIFEHATQVLSTTAWMEYQQKHFIHANNFVRLIGRTYNKGLGLSSSEEFAREAVKFHFFRTYAPVLPQFSVSSASSASMNFL